jgi:hypothetical protein
VPTTGVPGARTLGGALLFLVARRLVEAIREALDGRAAGDAGRSADRRTWDRVAAATVQAVLGRA